MITCNIIITTYLNPRFTPYLLLVASLFLVLTIGIYTAYPKLLNNYTRIMRHFAFALFLAYTCLWPQQMFPASNDPFVCKMTGMLQNTCVSERMSNPLLAFSNHVCLILISTYYLKFQDF